MYNIFINLPQNLQFYIFIILLIINLSILCSLIINNLSKRNILSKTYGIILISSFSLLTLTFLFLFANKNLPIFIMLSLYSPIVPFIYSIFLLVKYKQKINIYDSIFLLLLIPFYIINTYCIILYFLSIIYFCIREFDFAITSYQNLKTSINYYTIKQTLDNLDNGILIANKHNNIEYINISFLKLLKYYKINRYLGVDEIFNLLRFNTIKTYNTDFTLEYKDDIILITKNEYKGQLELVFFNITKEEKLSSELIKNNEILETHKKEVIKELRNVEKIAKDNEIIRIKTNLHDMLGEQLSIIHQFIDYDNLTNLVPIKKMIRENLYKNDYDIDLDELLKSYKLVGVNISINGQLKFNNEINKNIVKAIRECINNAIRHGNANKIEIDIKETNLNILISIKNNGSLPKEINENNGIKNIKENLSKINGELVYSLSPIFTANIKINK
jgi:hypothetical protein